MIRCVEHPPQQQTVPAEPSPRGVGGWLLFFVISLTILTPISLCYNAYNELKFYRANPSQLLFKTIAIDVSLRVIVAMLGIYAGIQLWRQKAGAPQVAKTYLVSVAVQQLLLVGLGIWLANKVRASLPDDIESVLLEPIRTFIYILIWYSYLNKSKRVAATFPASVQSAASAPVSLPPTE